MSGLIANHKLAAAISDCGFSEFRRQLAYKFSMYGTEFELVDGWYASSQTCSTGGVTRKLKP